MKDDYHAAFCCFFLERAQRKEVKKALVNGSLSDPLRLLDQKIALVNRKVEPS